MADETSAVTDTQTSTDGGEAIVETPAVETPADPAASQADPTSEATLLGGDPDESAEGEGDPAGDPAEEGPPEEYSLALTDAEGNEVQLDAEAVAEASVVFKELGLTNDQANKLMPVANSFMQRTQEAVFQQMSDAGAAQKKEWLDAFEADPDLGGKNRDVTTELAAKGLDAMGFKKDHPFRTLLNETGLGNHPDMIRAFKTLGEVVAEDGTFARSQAAGETETVGWSSRYKD